MKTCFLVQLIKYPTVNYIYSAKCSDLFGIIAEQQLLRVERCCNEKTHSYFIIISKRLMSNTVNITCRRIAATSGVRPNKKAHLKFSAWSVITEIYISLQDLF